MFVSRLREKLPSVPVTEAHPKALAEALGGWELTAAKFNELYGHREHERDAVLAAIAAREGYEGRWARNLASERNESEQDPEKYWLAPVHYFWPDC
jgi:predicted nuclease with RNAse H fold